LGIYFHFNVVSSSLLIGYVVYFGCVSLQVKWSGSPVEYSLEGEFPEMLFTINREGIIYLNAPLDRETQDQVKDKQFIQTFMDLPWC